MRSSSPDLGYFQEGAIDWLRRNCLSISQSASQARVPLQDYTWKIVYDVRLQFYVYQVELCEKNWEKYRKKRKKQQQKIRWGSLAWEAKDYATNEISSFRRDQNKLCPRCPLRRISNLEWSATDSHRSHSTECLRQGGEGTTRTAYYASIMNF